jgi:alanyl-tRNA synthetase
MNTLRDIRQTFLSYFAANGHTVVPSSSLVPENDATLLFANAGMNQFKDYFIGKRKPPFLAATTAQKCVRAGGKHNDLENVGYTTRHHTFFEMLGNFSFGEYFKERAIYHAWQVVTKELGVSPDKLCVTVFVDDDEAFSIWKKITGFPDSKIIRISTSDNFWEMGPTGPCGPCTEIFYDHGDSVAGGPPGTADADGDRFTEIWNVVFMQYERQPSGDRIDLPTPCIDTGMGLERIAAILQGKHNNFEVDLFESLINEIRKKTMKPFGEEHSCNVIADHIRSISFLIADGVMPLNEGRGYVLRRIIRRAFRHARILGATEPVLYKIVDKLAELMGDQYPELNFRKTVIKDVLKNEELRFDKTLDNGLALLRDALASLSSNTLPGDIAFKLYDTYGFPSDLTVDMLRDKGISVDTAGFDALMEEQRTASRSSGTLGLKSVDTANLEGIPEAVAEYYSDKNELSADVLAIIREENGHLGVVLDRTLFFPESCGQDGDKGVFSMGSTRFNVVRTYKHSKWIVHEVQDEASQIKVGDEVSLLVDASTRARIRAHHSATHLLQAALRSRLGPSVQQKGAFCDESRLRFDFSANQEVNDEMLKSIEHEINSLIFSALHCEAVFRPKDAPIVKDALAFFDEKYGDTVRVVRLAQLPSEEYFSTELCGGMHVSNTGQIGLIKILGERSISSGVRRIEAVCGFAALKWFDDVLANSEANVAQLKDENKKLARQLKQALSSGQSADVSREVVGSLELAIYKNVSGLAIRSVAEDVQSKLTTGAAFLASADDGVFVICVANKVSDKISAKEIVEQICSRFGGNGGGKATIAQAGGVNDTEGALVLTRELLEKVIL